jgi:uncharacterized protein YbjT (DUF2867 family)
MNIAVIGGTGVVGRHTVAALRRAGHDTVTVARSSGVDISTGEGLDDALAGVETVIDVTNTRRQMPRQHRTFSPPPRKISSPPRSAHGCDTTCCCPSWG